MCLTLFWHRATALLWAEPWTAADKTATYDIQGVSKAGMSNMRPFASTPSARTKDTVIWSFNGQNCSFYNLNWINVRRSQKNGPMLFSTQNGFYTWK
jgi:hypothetical protein